MIDRSKIRVSRLTLGLLAALAAAPAFAQSTSASMGGRVVADDGQPVANAEVVIVHAPSGTVSRTTTDENGRYVSRGLRVGGPYTITVQAPGYQSTAQEDVYAQLAETAQVNVALATESATTLEAVTITGTAFASTFSPDRMGTGTSISLERLEQLPSIQRNIQDYARLDPRVAQTDKGRGEISVGGQNSRYNAIRVDGVNTSDSFGLESNNFPTIRQPVSMDAIEAVNVDIANYDVTITGATGAVIDAVTKSGTNEFGGSTYYVYRDQDWVRENNDGSPFAGFTDEETYGATFGGPLIKDRLFFFTNYEKFTRTSPAASFGPIGSGASTEVDITQAQLAEAQQIARDVYGIDIGSLETPDGVRQQVEEYAIKLDWNISDDHRALYRFSSLEQVDPNLVGAGSNSLAFNSRWYDVNKTFDSHVLQAFSDWSSNFSTEFKVSQRQYDSISGVYARLPQMSIGFGDTGSDPDQPSNPFLNFGADQFRHGNEIRTTQRNAFGAGNLYVGDHTLKFGFDWEENDIFNLFAQNIWGNYQFSSLENFREGNYWNYQLNAPIPGFGLDSVAMNYKHRNTGFFLQDTWAVNYNLTLTFGVRVDIPDLDDVPVHNLLVQEIYGLDNRATLDEELWQPRFGFNYTFDSERPTQLRGGLGLFQGAAANVWVGNSYQNTGFGLIGYNQQISAGMSEAERQAIWAALPFNPDADNPTTPPPAAGYNMLVNLMEEGMAQPSVWKANLAFDHELPWHGVVASAELLLTQVKDGVHFERLDLGEATAIGQDGRPIYLRDPGNQASGPRANQNAEFNALRDGAGLPPGYENFSGWHPDGVIYMRNTTKGSSQQLTLSLEKPLVNNWSWLAAYTYTAADEVSPITSSRAISNWNSRAIFQPNEEIASTSSYEIKNRFIGVLNWENAFFGDYKTKFSLLYEGRSGRPHSWRFLNDMNGDGYVNDLLYVPTGPGDVTFTGGAEMEAAFFQFLADHPDLARYAGGPAARNGSRNRWVNTFDVRVLQELPGFFDGHSSELWIDVMNVGNLINKDWGLIPEEGPFGDRRAVNFRGIGDDGKYIYDFQRSGVRNPPLYDNQGQSRWAAQVGFRYRF